MNDEDVLSRLSQAIAVRRKAPASESYVAALTAKGLDAMLKKVGEESVEFVMAAKDRDRDHLVKEAADVWFHMLVALAEFELKASDILAELARREGVSGLSEKAARGLSG